MCVCLYMTCRYYIFKLCKINLICLENEEALIVFSTPYKAKIYN